MFAKKATNGESNKRCQLLSENYVCISFQQWMEADVSAWCNRLLWQIVPMGKLFLLQQLEAGSYLKPENLRIKEKFPENVLSSG